MANTATIVQALKIMAGTQTTINELQKTTTAAPTGTDVAAFTQDIPTTAGGTQIAFPAAMGSLGWSMFENLDSTNYVQIGRQVAGTFYPLLRVSAGKKAGPIELDCSTTQLYALANTATVKLRVVANEI